MKNTARTLMTRLRHPEGSAHSPIKTSSPTAKVLETPTRNVNDTASDIGDTFEWQSLRSLADSVPIRQKTTPGMLQHANDTTYTEAHENELISALTEKITILRNKRERHKQTLVEKVATLTRQAQELRAAQDSLFTEEADALTGEQRSWQPHTSTNPRLHAQARNFSQKNQYDYRHKKHRRDWTNKRNQTLQQRLGAGARRQQRKQTKATVTTPSDFPTVTATAITNHYRPWYTHTAVATAPASLPAMTVTTTAPSTFTHLQISRNCPDQHAFRANRWPPRQHYLPAQNPPTNGLSTRVQPSRW